MFIALSAIVLLGAGCGGSSDGTASSSIEETKACFASSGYTTSDRPDPGQRTSAPTTGTT